MMSVENLMSSKPLKRWKKNGDGCVVWDLDLLTESLLNTCEDAGGYLYKSPDNTEGDAEVGDSTSTKNQPLCLRRSCDAKKYVEQVLTPA